ncbi:hypothetical protein ACQEVC_35615 [Plantactinospora sp. CA-294935]|uniref:hypothetical protein n=1 Tax=Plantactinospora sp. CA-294935 TaxID=3240012 RepID=UPI003D8A4F47
MNLPVPVDRVDQVPERLTATIAVESAIIRDRWPQEFPAGAKSSAPPALRRCVDELDKLAMDVVGR